MRLWLRAPLAGTPQDAEGGMRVEGGRIAEPVPRAAAPAAVDAAFDASRQVRSDRVMVAGRWRVLDGTIPGLDLAARTAAHRVAAARLRAQA